AVGGSFHFSKTSKVGAEIRMRQFDFDNGASVNGDYKSQTVDITYFNQLPVEKFFLFWTAGARMMEANTDFSVVGSNDIKETLTTLPLTLGLEVPANSWLALRASVKQSVLIHKNKLSDALNDLETDGLDSTVVSAGASISFDQFSIDSTLAGADNGTGTINGNNLLANVGMKYTF
ncbi:MAG: hypothetical protein ABL958_02795, partial [Bdellovibrionia bacterium]